MDIIREQLDGIEAHMKSLQRDKKHWLERAMAAEARIDELEQNIADAVADAEMFKAENARYRAALEAVEFVMDGGEPMGHMDYSCPWCGAPVDYIQIKDGTAHDAHKPDCKRQQALEGAP